MVRVLLPVSPRVVSNSSPQSSPLREEERRSLRARRANFTAVLLAGGESRRMGKDKATLLFRGKPLWQIQLELLRKLGPAEIFLSGRTDAAWRPADVEFVADDPPSRGPLSGIAASLAQMHTAYLFALAIDMPFMSENYLHYLCDQIEPRTGVVPAIDSRAEPLAAISPRQAETEFRTALAGSDFSLQHVVRGLVESGKLREVRVKEQETKLFVNVNELSDLAAS
jgi:molybdopterin-guanine dinucleotide biosynthesis protein A